MAIEILMPELGESVHEGTVSRWLKKEGEFVKEDEPIVEIMTDKVNTELPSPASGILTKILIPEGGAVEVFHAMGLIEEAGAVASAQPTPIEPPLSATPTPKATPREQVEEKELVTTGGGERRWYTPVVRAIARENKVSDAELSAVAGTGQGGRVTKRDLEEYLARGRKPKAAPAATLEAKPVSPSVAGPDQELVPMAGIRKMIAEAMVRSGSIPTVSTVQQVDVTSMVLFRERNKDAFLEQYGVKLTYTPFFLKALTEALVEFPLMNSQLQPDMQILKNTGVHLGLAVALGPKGEDGLIVPVIRDCHKKNLVDLARDLDDITRRARNSELTVADVQGGTFTLSNPGTYGALFGTPMINAPQAGILGAYAISKQPVIVDDMIAIRSIMHLALTYDHRLIDGMIAGRFLASIRDRLQAFDFFK